MTFDADALLAALPKREIRPLPTGVVFRRTMPRPVPTGSALGSKGEYNGFMLTERNRTAALSNWLVAIGATDRPTVCDICRGEAKDEHAENYYDLTSWIGMCQRCHRALLHGRFMRPKRWREVLDLFERPDSHWSRMVAHTPFDIAALLRSRGQNEPSRMSFAVGEIVASSKLP